MKGIKVGRGKNAQIHTVGVHFVKLVKGTVEPDEYTLDDVYMPSSYRDLDDALAHASHVLSFDDDADMIIAVYNLTDLGILDDGYHNLPTVAPANLVATVTR